MTASIYRAPASYDALDDLSKPLVVPFSSRPYNRQFAALYDFRLRKLKHAKGRLLRSARDRWENGNAAAAAVAARLGDSQGSSSNALNEVKPHFVKRILDIEQGEICYVVGTIYCAMPLKQDVLEDLSRAVWLPPQPIRDTYADPERDEVFIEDESGRVRLVGDAVAPGTELRRALITGVVVALLGTETRAGHFEVADGIFPGLPPPHSSGKGKAAASAAGDDTWIALISGLELGTKEKEANRVNNTSLAPNKSKAKARDEAEADAVEQAKMEDEEGGGLGYAESELRMELLTEFLLGEIGSDEDRQRAARISSLVIAGNSMTPPEKGDTEKQSRSSIPAPSTYPTVTLDHFLTDLGSSMDVFLLPGEKDPASLALPQQPIHAALLPRANRFESLKRVTNPAWIGLGGRRILGTSGQNVDDLVKYVVSEGDEDEDRMRLAVQTLEWSHVAPTAPDTLWCFPFTDRDPFLIDEAPDIYFIGNQPRFGTRLVKGPEEHQTRVILVPRFADKGDVVLVNAKTLETRLVNVGIDVVSA